jgi:hypothetical protein
MADENSEKLQEAKQTLTDSQITSERTIGRRSFLTAVGAIVAGGAAALALGDRLNGAVAGRQQSSDPDQKKKRSEPDQRKTSTMTRGKRSDPDQKKTSTMKGKRSDPDQKKKKGVRSDPDQKKKKQN